MKNMTYNKRQKADSVVCGYNQTFQEPGPDLDGLPCDMIAPQDDPLQYSTKPYRVTHAHVEAPMLGRPEKYITKSY